MLREIWSASPRARRINYRLILAQSETNIYANARDKYSASLSGYIYIYILLSCENLPREVKLDVNDAHGPVSAPALFTNAVLTRRTS